MGATVFSVFALSTAVNCLKVSYVLRLPCPLTGGGRLMGVARGGRVFLFFCFFTVSVGICRLPASSAPSLIDGTTENSPQCCRVPKCLASLLSSPTFQGLMFYI